MKAILLSAGYGTRLRPLTWVKPKQFIDINGKSVIERNIDYLNSYNIEDIMVNLHYKPTYFMKRLGDRVTFTYENELLGEEGTIKRLFRWLDDYTVVMNADTLTNLRLDKMKSFMRPGESIKYMDHEVYAGVRIIPPFNYFTHEIGYFDTQSWWIDCGTWQGLKKARLML